MTDNAFGTELRRQRHALGLTLIEVASHLRLSVPYLSDVERGNRGPLNEAHLRTLAQAAGFDDALLLRTTGSVPDDVRSALLADPDLVDAIRYAVRRGVKGDEVHAMLIDRVNEAELRPIVERYEAAMSEAKRLLGEVPE